jgi:hypothetical protein
LVVDNQTGERGTTDMVHPAGVALPLKSPVF